MKRLTELLPQQRGQVALMMAVALPMIMGLAGISIDLGYGYAHRREAQNAADAAALAAAIALGRSYSHQSVGNGGCGDAGTSDRTNSLVTREATVAALSALPDFPTPPSGTGTPTLPSGTTVEVRYVSGYTDSGTTVPSNSNIAWTGTNPTPVGVRALVGYSYPTFF